MGSILGGSQTVESKVPEYIERAGQQALNMANQTNKIGAVINPSLDVADFTDLQKLGMQAAVDGAAAYGIIPQGTDAMSGMPQAKTVGGVRGFSSGDIAELNRLELMERNPAQFAALTKGDVPFGNPDTNPNFSQELLDFYQSGMEYGSPEFYAMMLRRMGMGGGFPV